MTRPPIALLFFALLFVAAVPCCASPEYFNRTAAEKDSKPDEVLARLGLTPGMRVADLGSGGGYFALRFARAVGPEGVVYAVDVNARFLAYVERAAAGAGLSNVKTVRARENDSGLATASVDLVFSRNVFHHLPDRVAYLTRLRRVLRPGGRMVIVEHASGAAHRAGHSTAPGVIKTEMQKVGFKLLAEESFLLPKQSFLVFGL